MKRGALVPLALMATALAVLLVGTRRDLSEPHLRLFNDMVRSPAFRSQYPNPVFSSGATTQPPVPGALARDEEPPLPYGATPEERERAGRELKNPFVPSFEVMTRGREVFERFCSHCHGPKGRGDGPVAKAFPSFSFPVAGKSTYDLPDGTLFVIVSQGRNLMPSHAAQLSRDDRWKAIAYLRDLQRQELARLGPLAVVPEDPRRHSLVSEDYGKELFASNCAACHGAEGRRPQPGIPTLNEPSVLAIAEDAYYWDIINHGRPGTQMPAWKSVLTPTQIKSLVLYIRSWAPAAPERSQVLALRGDPGRGRGLFSTHCAGCHGPEGRGGIGNTLNNPSFLSIASDKFLRDTISLGRRHTAMPASYDFKAQEVSDLIAYIRSWAPVASSFDEVEVLASSASAAAGGRLFKARCAGCHGADGEGGIGSRLASDGFLSMADDRMLYRAITEGRRGTEMPAWSGLTSSQVAELIAFIRHWQKTPMVALTTAPAQGRAEFGEVLFKQECVKCHGSGGEGDLGTQIGNPAFLSQVSDDFLRRTIAFGKKGTEMKGFATRARNPLGEQDIGHLIAYLRRLQNEAQVEPLKRHYSWASAKDGKAVFEKKADCAKCHGAQGEGGSGPSLNNPNFLRVASDGFLAATIVLGRENTPMPSFSGGSGVQLEQEDIENVVAYIRGFEKEPSPARRKVDRSAKNAAEGRVLFRENCARCHGPEGQGRHGERPGTFGPSLNNKEFLKAADDNFLLATIALGRPGTPMKPFALGSGQPPELTADQIRKVVAFIRTWEKSK